MQNFLLDVTIQIILASAIGYVVGDLVANIYWYFAPNGGRIDFKKRQQEFEEFGEIMCDSPLLFNTTILKYKHLFDDELLFRLKELQMAQVDLQMKHLAKFEAELQDNAQNLHRFPTSRQSEILTKIEESLTTIAQHRNILLTQVLGVKI